MQIWRPCHCVRIARTALTYLFVQLDVDWLVQLLGVLSDVADVLRVTQGLVQLRLFGHEVLVDGSGETIQWNWDYFGISDLFKFDVGNFLVGNDGGVVCGHVPWQFWEVGSHIDLIERCK